MMDAQRLTKRQSLVLAFLRRFQAETGRFPSFREVMTHFGWTGTNAVRDHFLALTRKGRLEYLYTGTAAGEFRLVADPGRCRSCGQALPEGA